MKIKHLREQLNTLPQEYDDYDLVFRKLVPYDSKINP